MVKSKEKRMFVRWRLLPALLLIVGTLPGALQAKTWGDSRGGIEADPGFDAGALLSGIIRLKPSVSMLIMYGKVHAVQGTVSIGEKDKWGSPKRFAYDVRVYGVSLVNSFIDFAEGEDKSARWFTFLYRGFNTKKDFPVYNWSLGPIGVTVGAGVTVAGEPKFKPTKLPVPFVYDAEVAGEVRLSTNAGAYIYGSADAGVLRARVQGTMDAWNGDVVKLNGSVNLDKRRAEVLQSYDVALGQMSVSIKGENVSGLKCSWSGCSRRWHTFYSWTHSFKALGRVASSPTSLWARTF